MHQVLLASHWLSDILMGSQYDVQGRQVALTTRSCRLRLANHSCLMRHSESTQWIYETLR